MSYHTSLLPFSLHKNNKYVYDGYGVIKTRIPYTNNCDYHLTEIASRCLYEPKDSRYIDENEEIVQANLKWIMKNINKEGVYQHRFVFPFYDFKELWVGGLAQGLTISALVNAYNKYKMDKYLNKAELVFDGLCENCLYEDIYENVWICEYPDVCSILNGMIYAMFGIYDLYRCTDNDSAEKLWYRCTATLLCNLHKYDLSYGSRYDLVNYYPATEFYHKIHIEQMMVLYRLTNYSIFLDYYEKWNSNYNELRCKLQKYIKALSRYGLIESFKRSRKIKQWNNG